MNATFMRRLTRRSPGETIRKRLARPALIGLLLAAGGCATPGPNHLYLVSAQETQVISDHAAPGIATRDLSSFVGHDETLLGFAYDPFTDHLFLQLAPGNKFRVVDRPDRSIKYEFTADGVPTPSGGDLAVRSLDRHLFLSDPAQPAAIEITLYGKFVRTIPLAGLPSPPAGIAYDQQRELICVLTAGRPSLVSAYDRQGRHIADITLDRPVLPGTLAYDSAAGEFYAQQASDRRIAVFDRQGRCIRELNLPIPPGRACFDVGPRSFLRLF
jgi:hypothetical protein